MKQELIDIITRLKRDPYRLLSVIDAETYKPIINSWSAVRIEQNYGSVEGFFNSLVNNGTIRIVVEERYKNGNSTRSMGDKKVFTLVVSEPEPETPSVPVEAPTAQPAVMPATPYHTGLNGLQALQQFGLGVPQLMDLHVSAHERTRLDTENKFLKEENERLKKEVAELKEERLEMKFSEAKAKGNNEMLLGLLQNAPALLGVLKGGAAPVGLSGATTESVEETEIPEGKKQLFDWLASTSPSVDAYLLQVLSGIYNSEPFYNDLTEVLKKHNLTEQ